jgi:excisionase family DNA binding protein
MFEMKMMVKRSKIGPKSTPDKPKNGDLMDVNEAAAFLRVDRKTVYRLFADGSIPHRKVGPRFITTRNAILKWIEAGMKVDQKEQQSTTDDIVDVLKNSDPKTRAVLFKNTSFRIRAGR